MRPATAVLIAATGSLVADVASAQEPRNELAFDTGVLSAAVSLAARPTPGVLMGLQLGFGYPKLDMVLQPSGDGSEQPDFEEHAYLAAFARLQPMASIDVDVGVRAGFATVWGCSGTSFEFHCATGFYGVYAQPMYGSRRIKAGARLLVASAGQSRDGDRGGRTRVVMVSPLVVRLTVPFQ